jgi:glycosyltransferase involved in cell wall biosynthesis
MHPLRLLLRRLRYSIQRPCRYRYLRALAAEKPEKVILFFPDYRKHNPHQKLLAAAMPDNCHYIAGTIEDALYFQTMAKTKIVFHLHWPDDVLYPKLFARFLQNMQRFRKQGGITIWTIHNLFPREREKGQVQEMQQTLAAQMDHIHLFSESSRAQVESVYRIALEKITVCPRGSYVGAYPNSILKEESRKQLGLPLQGRIISFFGQLRPYKGLDALFEQFEALKKFNPDLCLLVSGWLPPSSKALMQNTLTRMRHGKDIFLFPHFIGKNAELHLNATDILVLPYTDIINSGSFILGLSFGCCMVLPAQGVVAEMVTDQAITYDLADSEGLANALTQALSLSSEERAAIGKRAYALAQTLSWEKLAAILCKLT